MLDFNLILDFGSYLEFWMLNWIILCMHQNLRKSPKTFMLKLKSDFTSKSLKFN